MNLFFENIDWDLVLGLLGIILLPLLIVGLAFLSKIFLQPLIGGVFTFLIDFIVSVALLFLDLEFIVLRA